MQPKTNMPALRLVLTLAVIVVLILAGIGIWGWHTNQETKKKSSTPPVQAIVQINADNFDPATMRVKLGTVVVWRNMDQVPHRIATNPPATSSSTPNPAFDSGNLTPNFTYSYTPTKTGTIYYHDVANPQTNATIVVVER